MVAEKMLIVMTSGPETPRRCATPFFLASVGAAMEYDVSMLFTIDGILLLKKGQADALVAKQDGKPVGEFLRDAVDAGVKLYACTPAFELHDLHPEDLLEGTEVVGGAALIQMAAEADIVMNF